MSDIHGNNYEVMTLSELTELAKDRGFTGASERELMSFLAGEGDSYIDKLSDGRYSVLFA